MKRPARRAAGIVVVGVAAFGAVRSGEIGDDAAGRAACVAASQVLVGDSEGGCGAEACAGTEGVVIFGSGVRDDAGVVSGAVGVSRVGLWTG